MSDAGPEAASASELKAAARNALHRGASTSTARTDSDEPPSSGTQTH